MTIVVLEGDNLEIAAALEEESFDLIYIDPPFNTGKKQEIHGRSYDDSFDDFMGFILPRLERCHELLAPCGSFFLHIDPRESHYCKVGLDRIFGRQNFRNEIIWSYDYDGRPKSYWPWKHDVILWYSKSNEYCFRFDEIDRIPYMAPSLVGAEKAARGKTPTDVWWNTIVPTNGKERVDYPTQKPLSIIDRIVRVHSEESDLLLDMFAGSGTLGVSVHNNNRDCILIDSNPQAIEVMRKRLDFDDVVWKKYEDEQ